MELLQYIPLSVAADRYQVNHQDLDEAVSAGKMRAVQVDGFVAVSDDDARLLAMKLSDDLRGIPIRVTAAADKYGVSHANLSRWSDAGYIRIIERGPRLLVLDEGDVRRAVEVFKQALEDTGSSIRAGWALKQAMQED